MSGDQFERRPGEGPGEYVARLEAMDIEGLSESERELWADCLTASKVTRGLKPRELPPLERCKRAVRDLCDEDRRRLARWLAGGMRD